mmetsp:Transcript_23495/g.73724  ORF Transcript_23495/g.73724 Transcript_23495/m.73724 type:complete len:211 (+) Transcript_23495:2433-3065(+)
MHQGGGGLGRASAEGGAGRRRCGRKEGAGGPSCRDRGPRAILGPRSGRALDAVRVSVRRLHGGRRGDHLLNGRDGRRVRRARARYALLPPLHRRDPAALLRAGGRGKGCDRLRPVEAHAPQEIDGGEDGREEQAGGGARGAARAGERAARREPAAAAHARAAGERPRRSTRKDPRARGPLGAPRARDGGGHARQHLRGRKAVPRGHLGVP